MTAPSASATTSAISSLRASTVIWISSFSIPKSIENTKGIIISVPIRYGRCALLKVIDASQHNSAYPQKWTILSAIGKKRNSCPGGSGVIDTHKMTAHQTTVAHP